MYQTTALLGNVAPWVTAAPDCDEEDGQQCPDDNRCQQGSDDAPLELGEEGFVEQTGCYLGQTEGDDGENIGGIAGFQHRLPVVECTRTSSRSPAIVHLAQND